MIIEVECENGRHMERVVNGVVYCDCERCNRLLTGDFEIVDKLSEDCGSELDGETSITPT